MPIELFRNAPRIVFESGAIEVPTAVERKVDAIWKNELASRGDCLTDGQVLSVVRMTADEWTVKIARYRLVLARARDASLETGVSPLAITGVVRLSDGFLVGRRSDKVAVEPHVVEFMPAGGVSEEDVSSGMVDPVGAFRREWAEEIGFELPAEIDVNLVGYCLDSSTDTIDLILATRLPYTFERVRECWSRSKAWEHDRLMLLPPHGAPPPGSGYLAKAVVDAGIISETAFTQDGGA